MRLVIADTGPIHYLILIDHVDILPRLFERVVLPSAVLAELSHPFAPASVRRWAAAVPLSAGIHKGEAAAIALATAIRADLLLMDDRKAVIAAEKQGLNITGTLGVLDLAAELGLIDFAEAAMALELTTFRMPLALLEALLNKHMESEKP